MRGVAATVAVLAVGAGGLAAQGCGGSEGGSAAPDPSAGQLQLTYVSKPGVTPRAATLVCPASETEQQEACEEIESLTSAFDPVPADTACTQVYGGPEQIGLYGTWGGTRVDTTLNRTNGCEINRYAALAPVLLPLVGVKAGG